MFLLSKLDDIVSSKKARFIILNINLHSLNEDNKLG